MDLVLSQRSSYLASRACRRHVAVIAVALALANPSIAGANAFTFDFDILPPSADHSQVACGQKMQRNCVAWNVQPRADHFWPDFSLWADDLMYRRWYHDNSFDSANAPNIPETPEDDLGDPEPGPQLPTVSGPFAGSVGGPVSPLEVLNLDEEEDLPPGVPVPEPSSLSLLLASMAVGIGILARARRRPKQG